MCPKQRLYLQTLFLPSELCSVSSHLLRNKGFRWGHADLTKWIGGQTRASATVEPTGPKRSLGFLLNFAFLYWG